MAEAVCKFRLDLQIVLVKIKKYVGERVGKAETFHFKVSPPKKGWVFSLFVCLFLNLLDSFEIKWNKIYFISSFSFSALTKRIVMECFIWVERATKSMFWLEHFLCYFQAIILSRVGSFLLSVTVSKIFCATVEQTTKWFCAISNFAWQRQRTRTAKVQVFTDRGIWDSVTSVTWTWGASGKWYTRDIQDWHDTSNLISDREQYIKSEASITILLLGIRISR